MSPDKTNAWKQSSSFAERIASQLQPKRIFKIMDPKSGKQINDPTIPEGKRVGIIGEKKVKSFEKQAAGSLKVVGKTFTEKARHRRGQALEAQVRRNTEWKRRQEVFLKARDKAAVLCFEGLFKMDEKELEERWKEQQCSFRGYGEIKMMLKLKPAEEDIIELPEDIEIPYKMDKQTRKLNPIQFRTSVFLKDPNFIQQIADYYAPYNLTFSASQDRTRPGIWWALWKELDGMKINFFNEDSE